MAHNESKHVTATSVKMHAVVKQHNGNIQGELSCKYFEEPFKFSSLMSMIEMMETTFDAKGFPEKHMLPRTFGASKPRLRKHEVDLDELLSKYTSLDEDDAGGGTGAAVAGADDAGGDAAAGAGSAAGDKLCSFDISVRFRHNAEWQGSILWIEKDVTKQFSSIVELIKLIDNALAE